MCLSSFKVPFFSLPSPLLFPPSFHSHPFSSRNHRSSSSSRFALWLAPAVLPGFEKTKEALPKAFSGTPRLSLASTVSSQRLAGWGGPPQVAGRAAAQLPNTSRFLITDRARRSGDRSRAFTQIPTGGANLRDPPILETSSCLSRAPAPKRRVRILCPAPSAPPGSCPRRRSCPVAGGLGRVG